MSNENELSLEDSIEKCELELFETNRRITKVNKIIDTLQSIIQGSTNPLFTFLQQLKFSILTANEYRVPTTYGEALKVYITRLNDLEARVVELQEKYEKLTMQSYTK